MKPWMKLSYGVGHVLNDLCASMWFTYLLLYFHDVLHFDNKMAGSLMLLGQIADAVSTPLVGIESDRTKGVGNYGKRKSWHLLGTVLVAVSFPFIFNPGIGSDGSADWAKFIYYAPFVVIFQFGWATTQISHLSLIPDLTMDAGERVFLNSIRYFFTVMSNLVVYSVTFLLIHFRASTMGPSGATPAPTKSCPLVNVTHEEGHLSTADIPTFRILAFIMVGTGLVFSLIFHLGVKEKSSLVDSLSDEHQESINNSSHSTPDISDSVSSDHAIIPCDTEVSIPLLGPCVNKRLMSWREWICEPQFWVINLLYMCTRLIVNVTQVYISMYLTDTLYLHKRNIALVPLTIFISSLITSLVQKKMQHILGRKINYILGLLFIGGFCLSVWFTNQPVQMWHVYLSAALLGVGCASITVGALSMTADLIGTNCESSAFVYGAMSFSDKMSNGIAVEVIQFMHPCLSCCPSCHWFYRNIEVFLTAGFAIFGALVLIVLTPMTIGQRWRERTTDSDTSPTRSPVQYDTIGESN